MRSDSGNEIRLAEAVKKTDSQSLESSSISRTLVRQETPRTVQTETFSRLVFPLLSRSLLRSVIVTLRSTSSETRTCPQCLKRKKLRHFVGNKDPFAIVKWCLACHRKYHSKAYKQGKLRMSWRKQAELKQETRATLVLDSTNEKTGPIPTSMTSGDTCPRACSWYGSGCYAEAGFVVIHWRRVPKLGDSWKEFCSKVSLIPRGQLWRHNIAGDLPGKDWKIDAKMLQMLLDANKGKRGFTFTHKYKKLNSSKTLLKRNIELVRHANASGFTVNWSADTLDDADRLADTESGPVTVVVPDGSPKHQRTRAGRHVIVCPAQYQEGVTCSTCGMCSVASRKGIVAFWAHGQQKERIHLKVLGQPRSQPALPFFEEN